MKDLTERKLVYLDEAIDAVEKHYRAYDNDLLELIAFDIERLPSAQPDNQVHLCDSCKHNYPDCPSGSKDVIFGNGNGNDNICACNKYKPSSQPEVVRCKDCKWFRRYANTDITFCDLTETCVFEKDFCSRAGRWKNE